MEQVILVRYGEIGLKGRNRPAFENRLVKNIRAALSSEPVAVHKQYGRIIVVVDDENARIEQIINRVRGVFGIVSVSPASVARLDMDDIKEKAKQLLAQKIEREINRTVRFKVETRRANKRFPLKSPQISAQIGGFLLRQLPGLTVDVHQPDVTVWIDIRDEEAYVYVDVFPGHGGLPIGASGRGLLLLSGGIDSPVAGWYALKRGIALEAIHFHSFPYTSERSLEKVVDLAATLGRIQHMDIPLHVIHFTPIQDAIQQHIAPPSRITVMRRMMVRIAEALARKRHIPALITGESVGQVASQTLESMAVINAVTHMPIIRPLVTMDKDEIVRVAKQIGTYDVSILPYDDCCSLFVPDRPETKPRLERIQRMEAALDMEALIKEALLQTEVIRG